MPLTFLAAKTKFASYGSTVGAQINFTLARAFMGGKFKGTVAYAAFPIFDADENGMAYRQITLGRRFETALGVKFEATTGYGCPRPLHNQWWRWMQRDLGYSPNGGLEDMGEVCIFRDLPSAGKIKIYNSTTESAGSFHVRGISGGANVFTGTGGSRIEGENIAMPTTNGTSTLSATTFDAGASLYHIVKPSTNGIISLYHVAADTTETLIGLYEPGELVPQLRRYRISSTNTSDTALIMAKLRHVDLVADNDPVIPDNEVALYFGLKAKNYEDKQDSERANEYLAKFFDALNGQLRESQGNMPLTIKLRSGEGFGSIRQGV